MHSLGGLQASCEEVTRCDSGCQIQNKNQNQKTSLNLNFRKTKLKICLFQFFFLSYWVLFVLLFETVLPCNPGQATTSGWNKLLVWKMLVGHASTEIDIWTVWERKREDFILFWIESCYVIQPCLELSILPHQPPQRWDPRHPQQHTNQHTHQHVTVLFYYAW